MVVRQHHKDNFVKKLLIGVAFFSVVAFLSGGDVGLSSRPLANGSIVQSWNSLPIYIDGNAQLAAYCSGNGSGTPASPFVIKDARISGAGASGAGLYINNTNAFLVIQNCTVMGATSVTEVGIYVNNCSNVIVTNCTASVNNYGVVLANCSLCAVNASVVSSNVIGIGITLSSECNVTLCVTRNNTYYGIGADTSSDVLISKNDVSENLNAGIAVQFTTDSIIEQNEIADNTYYGILLSDSDDNNITSNVISGRQGGIILSAPASPGTGRSERNQVFENNITHNTNVGILLERASQNDVYLNNFVGNGGGQARVAAPGSNNRWNKTTVGNYFDDYQTRYPGASNDGVTWDLPYIIQNLVLLNGVNHSYHALVTPVKPNHDAPVLTSGTVTPTSGTSLVPYTFTVTYSDVDDNYPISMNVVINGSAYPMSKVTPGDSTFSDGCAYRLVMYLQPGENVYHFECSDTKFTRSTMNVSILVSGSNSHSPTLNGGTVFPARGLNGVTVFDFAVVYTDADNNEPAFVQIFLNWGSSLTLNLFKQNEYDTNYMDGCKYVLNTTLSGVGNYTYYFTASDGFNNGISSTYSGLEVDAASPIATNGMAYGWSGWLQVSGEPIPFGGTETFIGGPSFTVFSGFPTGSGIRVINGTSRLITSGSQFHVGSHEPVRIFTDVVAGRPVPVSVWAHDFGDQHFLLVGNVEFLAANRLFKCWKMQSVEGSVAYFDMYSGFLVNGTFVSYALGGMANYSMQITGVNPPGLLQPNTNAPTLTGFPVNPSSGNQATAFTFQVTYTDADDLGPVSINVTLNGTNVAMQKLNPLDMTYTDGCTYVLTTYLQPGTHVYSYSTSDGSYSDITGLYPSFQVSIANTHAPALSVGSMTVTPSSGFANVTPFLYSVLYTDSDNNAPKYVNVTINSTTYPMEKRDVADVNYMDGAVYVLSRKLQLVGSYTYQFLTSDGIFTSNTAALGGPTVLAPVNVSFDGMQYNYTRVTYLLGFATPSNESESHGDLLGNGIFNITSTWIGRAVNASTRELPMDYGSLMQGYFYAGTHDFTRIFTNVQIGSHVLVSVLNDGDQDFTITGTALLEVMARPFNCWVMTSPEGSIAYYDRYSGILVNGTFLYKILGSEYRYSIQVRGTNVPLAPNAHFPELVGRSVLPISGNQSSTFHFNITYVDLDGNASSYVRMFFDGNVIEMVKTDVTDLTYTDGCVFTGSVSLLQPASYSYYFTTNDGEFSRTTGNYTLVVGQTDTFAPVLTGPVVLPPSVPARPAPYTFRVTYTDQDNNAPESIDVIVNGTSYPLSKQVPGDADYRDGCVFQASVSLSPGTYWYNFTCADPSHNASTGTATFTVNVFAPSLVVSFNPPNESSGPANFTISVIYTDCDNNAPTYVNITINGKTYAMVRQNPLDVNFIDGCVFTLVLELEIGSYPYTVVTADFLFTSEISGVITVSEPFPLEIVIVVVAVVGGVVVLGAVIRARRKKSKKATISKKQKANAKSRDSVPKNLPEVSIPGATPVPPPLQYQGVPVPSLGRFQCPSCAKEISFQVADLSQQYTCPDCSQLLLRLVTCTKCGKPMSITQENFPQYVGKDLECPDCKNVFRV